ncbi:GNAT family N-acetyltransferase [Microlunatus flavus]|uniref:Ribosomal protein S18 acetylase RimI n=1 Tax=Microlunatus flavus TaxID=1036181 RepID=A0A1H9AH87_9ACTN|nr:GNAT family N-acetyltransferase [Microlunatus flavus]SEP76104.1 Ribosomal protein S18 acetylase RimI [Microlunatus flavus]
MITARPLVAADLDAVVGLLHAYDRRWFGEPVLSAADVRSEWSSPAFRLAEDSEGWFDDGDEDVDADADGGDEHGDAGTLVAFGTLGTRGEVEVAVDEAWEDAGLQDALLERWEGEARRRGFPAVHRELPADDREGLDRLLRRGWVAERTGWILRLDADDALEPGPLPAGYALREVTEADVPAVHAVVRDAFSQYGPSRRTYEDWRAGLVDRPDVDLRHWRLATHAGEVVGACLVVDPAAPAPGGPEAEGAEGAGEAWVPQVAVADAHRRRGLARALLVSVAAAARERGVPRLGLYTHEGTGALGLYERIGLRVVHTLTTCTLEL